MRCTIQLNRSYSINHFHRLFVLLNMSHFSLNRSLLLSCEATRNYNTQILAVFHTDTSFFLWSGWLSSLGVESLN